MICLLKARLKLRYVERGQSSAETGLREDTGDYGDSAKRGRRNTKRDQEVDSREKSMLGTQRKGKEYLKSKADLLGEKDLPEAGFMDEQLIKVARFDVTFEQIF